MWSPLFSKSRRTDMAFDRMNMQMDVAATTPAADCISKRGRQDHLALVHDRRHGARHRPIADYRMRAVPRGRSPTRLPLHPRQRPGRHGRCCSWWRRFPDALAVRAWLVCAHNLRRGAIVGVIDGVPPRDKARPVAALTRQVSVLRVRWATTFRRNCRNAGGGRPMRHAERRNNARQHLEIGGRRAGELRAAVHAQKISLRQDRASLTAEKSSRW